MSFAPGWYPDPDDSSMRRYWDGENWSAPLVRPKPSPAGQGPPPMAAPDARLPAPAPKRQSRGKLIAISTAAVAVVAAAVVLLVLQPWKSDTAVTADAPSATASKLQTSFAFTPKAPAPSEPAEPTELSIGSPLSVTSTDPDSGDESTAQSTVTKVSSSTYDSETDESPKQGRYVIVHVTLKGTQGAVEFNPNDFYVTGSDGETYQDATYSDTWGTPLTDVTVHGGETSSGTLVYDVSKAGLSGKVFYSPNSDGQPIGFWDYAA